MAMKLGTSASPWFGEHPRREDSVRHQRLEQLRQQLAEIFSLNTLQAAEFLRRTDGRTRNRRVVHA